MENNEVMRPAGRDRALWKGCLTVALCVIAAFSVIWMCTAKTPFMHSPYCPYALQAQRWLEGHLDLGQDYPWLELAIYQGRYYVSFPPLPTLFVLPFVWLLGVDNTPEYFITAVLGVVGAVQMFRLFCLFNRKRHMALLWALLCTIGSNYLLISNNGDVWLLAQTAAFMFTASALYYAATDAEKDGKWPLLWLACAVGCRPLNIFYLPVVAWLLLRKFKRAGLGFWGAVKKHWLWLLPPLCVGFGYMALNQARFGNPFQFGHDYLPEFTRSADHRQFDIRNIPGNLAEKFFRIPQWSEGWLRFPKAGFAFFIASPVYGVGFVCLVRRVAARLRGRRGERAGLVWLIGACVSLHLLMLCTHPTMGGIQWGLRYTIDAIPAAALGIGLLLREEDDGWLSVLLPPALAFGLCLNLVGTLAILNDWSIFL